MRYTYKCTWNTCNSIVSSFSYNIIHYYLLVSLDVIGVCKNAEDVSRITTKSSREVSKRTLHLIDSTGTMVAATLWGEEVIIIVSLYFIFLISLINIDGFANKIYMKVHTLIPASHLKPFEFGFLTFEQLSFQWPSVFSSWFETKGRITFHERLFMKWQYSLSFRFLKLIRPLKPNPKMTF